MTWDEWDNLEWWEQYSLIEGLRAEGTVQGSSEAGPPTPQQQVPAKTAADQSLQSIGVQVRTVQGKADWE